MQPGSPYIVSSPPAAPPPTPGWFKGIVGCAIGCGALVVLVAIAGIAGAWWFVAPGEQHATSAIVAASGDGSFRVEDLGADPGIAALVDHFVFATQRQQQQDMPPWLRQLQQMGNAGSPSASFRMFLPRQATVTLEPAAEPGGEPELLVAFNPRGMTRLLRTMLGQERLGEHRGKEIYRLGATAAAAFVDGTVLMASREEPLRAGIDRLLAGGGAPTPPPDLGAPQRSWDLTGAIANRDGAVERLLWRDREAPGGMRQATLGVDVATADLTAGRFLLDCDSPEAASAAAEALVERAREKAAELAADGLELRAAPRVEGARAILDWEVHGLQSAIEAWVMRAGEERYAGAEEGYGEEGEGDDLYEDAGGAADGDPGDAGGAAGGAEVDSETDADASPTGPQHGA